MDKGEREIRLRDVASSLGSTRDDVRGFELPDYVAMLAEMYVDDAIDIWDMGNEARRWVYDGLRRG